jgi:hypothetical protein
LTARQHKSDSQQTETFDAPYSHRFHLVAPAEILSLFTFNHTASGRLRASRERQGASVGTDHNEQASVR